MKRWICILLTMSVLASAAAVAAGTSILRRAAEDVSARVAEKTPGYQAADWAKNELTQADEAGLVPESLAGKDLTRPITRQEYAAAAVALYDKLLALNPGATVMVREASVPAGTQFPFTDVDDEAVTLAWQRYIIEGVGNGRFDPNGLLTREQAAAMMQRIITQTGLTIPRICGTNFVNMADRDTVSDWAREGAALMANLGVIQGKPDGNGVNFDPRGTLTCQEALVMNQRLGEQMAGFAQDAAEQGIAFPAAFFEAVQSEEANKSLSPVSAQYALGLLRAGAAGETRDQLDRLLSGADFAVWNQVLRTAGGGPTVEVANSIWFDLSVSPTADYLNTVKKTFDAESKTLSLSTRSAVQTINRWVSDKTHGLITSILDQPLSDDAAAVVLNALYFKGDWTFPFDPTATYEQIFHGRNGGESRVPFMHKTRRGTQLISTDSCIGVALPYDGGPLELPQGADPNAHYPTNSGWWMLALLPRAGGDAETLAAQDFGSLLAGAQGAYVKLALPKFTVEGTYDLTGPLKNMGLTAAFSGGDFSGMGTCSKGELVLSRVIQKTYLRVDEEGTEAAAVTGAVVGATSAIIEEPIELTFDRPFLCCLWNDQISQPLFLTAVNELK